MAAVADVTDATFPQEVLESDAPVLVDFWAAWCGPCRAMSRVLDELAGERDDLRIVKVNVDENVETAQRYGIQGLPLMILFRGGEETVRISGAKPRRRLEAELASALA